MMNLFSKIGKNAGRYLPVILISSTMIIGCTTENEEIETFSSNNELLATPTTGKTYYIKSVNSGRYIDVDGANNSNGANIQQWAFTGATNQQWEILSTGGNTVRFKGVDSGKSLEVSAGNTSNGGNVQQWEYLELDHQKWVIHNEGNDQYSIENDNSGRYLDVSGFSTSNGGNIQQWSYTGNSNQKWIFEEVGNSGSSAPLSSGGDAEDIIGNGWKLNGFTGNLNVGSNDNGLDYEDDASTDESHFFFERNGYAAFRCYPGNPTSGGSSNARSELREIIDGGDGYWNGDTSTEHSMKWKFVIEDLPPSGKLAFGQIHERDDRYDDVIRVQVEGDSGQNSGDVKLRILGYVTEEVEDEEGRTIDFDMRMDTEYYFEITMSRGVVRVYDLNSNGSRREELFESVDIGNANENYFKAGCYLQSTSSSHEDSNTYGQVLVKDLEVSPDN